MTDRYTKAVLTVIAAALLALAAQNAMPPVQAQRDGIAKVQICDSSYTCLDLGRVYLGAGVAGRALPVVTYSTP